MRYYMGGRVGDFPMGGVKGNDNQLPPKSGGWQSEGLPPARRAAPGSRAAEAWSRRLPAAADGHGGQRVSSRYGICRLHRTKMIFSHVRPSAHSARMVPMARCPDSGRSTPVPFALMERAEPKLVHGRP